MKPQPAADDGRFLCPCPCPCCCGEALLADEGGRVAMGTSLMGPAEAQEAEAGAPPPVSTWACRVTAAVVAGDRLPRTVTTSEGQCLAGDKGKRWQVRVPKWPRYIWVCCY